MKGNHFNAVTYNYNDDSAGGGFHEFYEVKFLSSAFHAVEVLRSIIILNKVYNTEAPLHRVDVDVSNKELLIELRRANLDERFGVVIHYTYSEL